MLIFLLKKKAILLNLERKAQGKRPRPFRCLVVLPLHPNGRFLDSVECAAVMACQFEAVGRGEKSLLGRLRAEFPSVDIGE